MIAVVDIDGVLADASHRQHLVESHPKDWDAFFAQVGGDALIEHGRSRLVELGEEHDVVLLTGRPERTRADTESWLARHEVTVQRVVMRPDADRRPAARFKAEAIRAIGSPSEVTVVVDDDASVTTLLAASGYRIELFR